MIQSIAPHRYCNTYCNLRPAPQSPVLVYDGGRVLCGEDSHVLTLPCRAMLAVPEDALHFAFYLDDAPVFLADCLPEQLPEGFALRPTRPLRTAEPQHLAWAIGVGESLWRWYCGNRFCGRCGTKMQDKSDERARLCSQCGHVQYPKICPAVIVAVTDGDRLVLTRYANRPFRSYALVAGFNEIGESIEDTVAREVMEETGLKIRNLRFYRSQPWVFTDSLLMGFYADLDGSDVIHIQESELAEASWYHRREIPSDYSTISLTGEMIERFRLGAEPRRNPNDG